MTLEFTPAGFDAFQNNITEVSTVRIGTASSTGTANQALQVGTASTPLGGYISGNLGIGTTNPTTTLQVNGTTKVETSIGSTQSVWTTTLDSKSGSLNNVGLLVQPESVYTTAGTYSPVVFSAGLTTSLGGTIYGVQNYVNVAPTGNTFQNWYGIYNSISRDSILDTSNRGTSFVSYNLYNQGTNVSSTSGTISIVYNTYNLSTISKGLVLANYNTYNWIQVAVGVGQTANVSNAFGSYNTTTIGASSGTGFGTITSYYGTYVRPVVSATGTLTNYYGLYLDTPSVSGTLTNRWGIYSLDPNTQSYHQGNILVGSATSTGTASQRLQVTGGVYVSGNIGVAATSPSFPVDVAGDVRVRSTNAMRFGGTAGTTNFYIQYNSTANSLDFVAG